jgi:hypothetical protein
MTDVIDLGPDRLALGEGSRWPGTTWFWWASRRGAC